MNLDRDMAHRSNEGCVPVDNAPVVESLHSLSHAEEAVLDIVSPLLPASTVRQPVLHTQKLCSSSC